MDADGGRQHDGDGAIAELVLSFPLEDHTEPAPVFEA